MLTRFYFVKKTVFVMTSMDLTLKKFLIPPLAPSIETRQSNIERSRPGTGACLRISLRAYAKEALLTGALAPAVFRDAAGSVPSRSHRTGGRK